MKRSLDTVVLGAALLVVSFAAGELAYRAFPPAVWTCSTDTECERLEAYVEAHRGLEEP